MTITITDQQYAAFGKRVAARLGANREWDSAADYLETFAFEAESILGVTPGAEDDDLLAFWRAIADEVGVEHDGEENPECECAEWFHTSEVFDENGVEVEGGRHEHVDAGLPGTDDLTGCGVAGCLCEHVAGWGRWL